jgi:hypothetical protein
MPPQLNNIPTSKASTIMPPLGHKYRVLTFESQRETYGDLAVNARVSGHPPSTSTRPTNLSITHESAPFRGDQPTLADNGQDTMLSRFLDLPRELRDMVYGYLLCDTKIIFKFLDMKIHALYDSEHHHDISASTTLPSWLLTNKTILKEGIERFQRYGEIVVELEHGGILLNAFRYPPSPYRILNKEWIFVESTAQLAAKFPKRQALIDLTKFRTLVLHSSSSTISFAIGSQCIFTRKNQKAIRRLAKFLRNEGQCNEFRTFNIELVANYGVDKRMLYGIHPLNELAGSLPAFQTMLFTTKEHGIDSRFDYTLTWRLYGEWFRLIRGLATTLFGEDSWKEEKVMDLIENESTLVNVLRVARKST